MEITPFAILSVAGSITLTVPTPSYPHLTIDRLPSVQWANKYASGDVKGSLGG